MKPLKTILERIPLVAQAQMDLLQEETAEARLPETCDSCSAKALIRCSMPFGTLFFCMHHYNKHATALKQKGAKATPLF